jgi:hypothetical protein
MNDVTRTMRRVFAIVAIVCFFLPLGQCTQADRNPTAPGIHISGTTEFIPAKEIELPPKSIERLGSDLLLTFPFVWPALIAIFSSRVGSLAGLRMLIGFEIFASAVSLYFIGGIWLRMYGEIRPAGYFSIATYVGYLALSLFDAGRMIARRNARDRAKAAPS